MTEARYKIVFDGQLMPDMALETVKENLARLFKSEQSKIDALFSGSPVALKRDLAEAEADKYLAALQKAGALVRKESEGIQLSLMDTEDHRQDEPSSESAVTMECPKCGHSQPKSAECSACGVIIEKYLARQAQQPTPQESPAAPAASTAQPSPYSPPQAEVGDVLPEFGDLRVFTLEGRIGRLRYLAWSMALMFAAALLYGVAAMGFVISDTVAMILMGIVGIGALVASVFLGVQRLHDIGWSGWLYLLQLVPIAGFVIALLMLVVPGTNAANRYGPPPPPNSTGVKVLAALWLLVPVLGILAAIAIPAYQDYLARAGM
ncbi:DUF805 domain-containing protein [Pseudomonas sp. BMS12]|uniref:DUF805 domain-containing protein n=1 Tax=Pseudomonas sp. BMS12 TaxID=1796033 RepID=UPI00083B7374|nr:DUF805 domain-containing protein [Pseudomonas sp. BMS12]